MKRLLLLPVVVAAFLSVGAGSSYSAPASNFDSGVDGWSVIDIPNVFGNPPAVVATYNPVVAAGYSGDGIKMTDPSSNFFFFSAPAKFLGDMSLLLNGSVSFKVYHQPDTIGSFQNGPLAVLVGQGKTLYYSKSYSVPSSQWTDFTLSVSSGNWNLNTQFGLPAAQSDISAVVASLDAFYINGDIYSEYDATTLDDVEYMLVPEPGSAVAMALGCASFGILLRRRQP